MICRKVLITGRVQGVGFRASVMNKATQIGQLLGYVRNLDSGQVEVLVAGNDLLVLQMVTYCSKGPLNARVDRLEIEELAIPDAGLETFTIRR